MNDISRATGAGSARRFDFSLTTKITLAVVGILSAVLILGGMLAYRSESVRNYAALEATAAAILERASVTTAGPLWDMNAQLAEDMLRGEMLQAELQLMALYSGADESRRRVFLVLQRKIGRAHV